MTKPLKLAVVGHTNVGKTSLLRTLTRDVGFGEVSHRPSTTRHVEGARLSVDGEALLELYDTPGLEDAIALLDYLARLDRPGERLDGPARLARFLDGSEARQRFEQEAKVLRQLLILHGRYVCQARKPRCGSCRIEDLCEYKEKTWAQTSSIAFPPPPRSFRGQSRYGCSPERCACPPPWSIGEMPC